MWLLLLMMLLLLAVYEPKKVALFVVSENVLFDIVNVYISRFILFHQFLLC